MENQLKKLVMGFLIDECVRTLIEKTKNHRHSLLLFESVKLIMRDAVRYMLHDIKLNDWDSIRIHIETQCGMGNENFSLNRRMAGKQIGSCGPITLKSLFSFLGFCWFSNCKQCKH
jgi:uncharacterized protein YpiB (UPF0302 family)